MFKESCFILKNEKVAPGHYALKLGSPNIGRSANPGQFVQILCSDSNDPLLPRPFSFLETSKKDFTILYQVVGEGTKLLSRAKPGATLRILGPLGKGFTLERMDRGARSHQAGLALLAGGGVGIPPLYHLAKTLRSVCPKKEIHVFLGARNKALLLCEKDFKKLSVSLHLATDDGSSGQKGFVTQVLEAFLKKNKKNDGIESKIFTCGPTPMLQAVSQVAQKFSVPCEVSVEVPMACGFGACLGCAIPVKEGDGHRYAIACCEGPVFQADKVLWS